MAPSKPIAGRPAGQEKKVGNRPLVSDVGVASQVEGILVECGLGYELQDQAWRARRGRLIDYHGAR